MLTDTVISWIRTTVPVIVGALVAWLQPLGIELDTVGAITVATIFFTSVYYAGARLLEQKYPQFGWLLGVPRAPKYTDLEK